MLIEAYLLNYEYFKFAEDEESKSNVTKMKHPNIFHEFINIHIFFRIIRL